MTRQCPWPSGIHNYRAGTCTRCGAVLEATEYREPRTVYTSEGASARLASDKGAQGGSAGLAVAEGDGDCAKWHALDIKYQTPRESPLHHDNRCKCELVTVR